MNGIRARTPASLASAMQRLPVARTLLAALVLFGSALGPARAQGSDAAAVELDALTWTELRDRIAAGMSTVLVPVGGTEQSGPHLTLGKHTARVRVLADRIAAALGQTVVAPVVAYVPEGSIDPPAGHMRFPGTISIAPATFEALLESAAKSLCHHGLRRIVFLGDHGGYQDSLQRATARLNRAWGSAGTCRAVALLDYYRASQDDFEASLRRAGHADAEIGTHAGLADTALMLGTDPAQVRRDRLGLHAGPAQGVHGDPAHATAALGQPAADHVVAVSVQAIRAAFGAAR